jgi:hypothetical protein
MAPAGVRVSDLHAGYQALPAAGSFHVLDLQRAEKLLVQWGLVSVVGDWLQPSEVLQELVVDSDEGACESLAVEALGRRSSPWLVAAVTDEHVTLELLPDEVTDRLSSAFPDPDRREAILLAAGRLADETRRHAVGSAGEEFVVACAKAELCRLGRPALANEVVRLSLRSDQLGYDVRVPRLPGGVWRLEVKASVRDPRALEFFISRSEAETGRRLSDWLLTACHLPPTGEPAVIGWCRFEMLEPLLPRDVDANTTWQSARVRVPAGLFRPGLPPLDV